MKSSVLAVALLAIPLAACSEAPAAKGTAAESRSTAERNKRLAREFYENLWFSNNTAAYTDYMADEYAVHDIGGESGNVLPGIRQKEIADRFHGMGAMSGEFDYQIAEGDKVATRWWWSLKVNEQGQAMGMQDIERLPIINVFRFNNDGKIVEIWNHRHDVDIPRMPRPPER